LRSTVVLTDNAFILTEKRQRSRGVFENFSFFYFPRAFLTPASFAPQYYSTQTDALRRFSFRFFLFPFYFQRSARAVASCAFLSNFLFLPIFFAKIPPAPFAEALFLVSFRKNFTKRAKTV